MSPRRSPRRNPRTGPNYIGDRCPRGATPHCRRDQPLQPMPRVDTDAARGGQKPSSRRAAMIRLDVTDAHENLSGPERIERVIVRRPR
jgi:hypothetical protein